VTGKTAESLRRLRAARRRLERDLVRGLSPWERVQLARHPDRPSTLDYVRRLCTQFVELHGDRRFADDGAVVGGLARFAGRAILVVGHQRGRAHAERIARNFGMARPEGYHKAVRLFELAGRFGRPVLTFVDTQGAYPGIGAEERGQAEAIAASLTALAGLGVPVVCALIGEGGSGGALALAVADRVLMQEHAWYSVISPEGCASILFRRLTPETVARSAALLRLTAEDARRRRSWTRWCANPAAARTATRRARRRVSGARSRSISRSSRSGRCGGSWPAATRGTGTSAPISRRRKFAKAQDAR